MLVLSRKLDQQIQIGENIRITVVRVKGNTVRIGIEAPQEVRVMRTELAEQVEPKPQVAAENQVTEPSNNTAVSKSSSTMASAESGEVDPEQQRHPFRRAGSRFPGMTAGSSVRRSSRMGPAILKAFSHRG